MNKYDIQTETTEHNAEYQIDMGGVMTLPARVIIATRDDVELICKTPTTDPTELFVVYVVFRDGLFDFGGDAVPAGIPGLYVANIYNSEYDEYSNPNNIGLMNGMPLGAAEMVFFSRGVVDLTEVATNLESLPITDISEDWVMVWIELKTE